MGITTSSDSSWHVANAQHDVAVTAPGARCAAPPCTFITTADCTGGITITRRICVADHNCPARDYDYHDVTADYYDHRTGRLHG
jgi:hypothetical protein